jgi:hypothetical protein
MDETKVLGLLADEVKQAGTAAAWAARHNLSQQYVNDVMNGRRPPAKSILDALCLEKVVTYRRIK